MPRILCVEDHDDSCELIALLLRRASGTYHVETAKSAEQATRMISVKAYDAYILDCWLPEMDGVDLCWWIRETGSTVPILFFTGADDWSDRDAGLAAGANAYLSKPHQLLDLPAELDRLLREEAEAGYENYKWPWLSDANRAGNG
ncbi:MAG TPA: response regulator [Pyrinomonadaceae bacterium]|jgi:DNA-binding response OmpR family regulator|nr:response regulator [Pyrinomonadaceae bacterium]